MRPGGDVTTDRGDVTHATTVRRTRASARRVAVLVLLGCALVQAAWIATLPPYRGTDEIDHAYRAAQVAGGDWAPSTLTVPGGRGQLVSVPATMVRAARPVCTSYEYMRPDNCFPVRALGDDRVLVSSSAAAYNPVFYAAVGQVANVWDGTAALYGMRAAAALLCAVFVALAAWCLRLWAATAWPLVALLAGATPIITFSFSMAAPNGIEIAAALALWCALLGCATARGRDRHARALLTVATVSAAVACVPRSLGPFWVLAIAATTLPLIGRAGIGELLRAHWRLLAAGGVVVLTSALAAATWTRAAGTQGLAPFDAGVDDRWAATVEQVPLWFLQGIAAFPRRSDPAPLGVYLLLGPILLVLLVVGFRRAARGLRWTMAGCLVFALGVPFLFTLTSITFSGPLWQGRYGAPYHLGLFLLAGLALDRRPPALRHVRAGVQGVVLAGGLAAALTVGQVWSMLHVLARERSVGPYAGSSAWSGPAPWVVVVLGVGAALLLLAAAAQTPATRAPDRPD